LLGVGERSFRRNLVRYEAESMDGPIEHRLEQVSRRRAPVDEVLKLTEGCLERHQGWNARHFHAWYRKVDGTRGCSRVKTSLKTRDSESFSNME
jgi:hypothetical protein